MKRAGLAVRPVPPRATPLQPRYDANGLVPVVVRDVETGDVLTLAWANAAGAREDAGDRPLALLQPLAAGALEEGRDVGPRAGGRRDLVRLRPRRRALRREAGRARLPHRGADVLHARGRARARRGRRGPPRPHRRSSRRSRTAGTARRQGSYTNRLLESGAARIAQKVGEEAVETALAAVGGTDEALANEAADLLYHLAVLLTARGSCAEGRRGGPREAARRAAPGSEVSAAVLRPVVVERPADLTTPVALMKALLAGEAPCFLLESVEGGDRVARWSFLGAAPSGEISGAAGDPFELLKALPTADARGRRRPAAVHGRRRGLRGLRRRAAARAPAGDEPGPDRAAGRVVRDLRLRHRVRPRPPPPSLRDARGGGRGRGEKSLGKVKRSSKRGPPHAARRRGPPPQPLLPSKKLFRSLRTLPRSRRPRSTSARETSSRSCSRAGGRRRSTATRSRCTGRCARSARPPTSTSCGRRTGRSSAPRPSGSCASRPLRAAPRSRRSRSRVRARAAPRARRTSRSRRTFSQTRRSGPSTSCSWTSGATTSAGSRCPGPCA